MKRILLAILLAFAANVFAQDVPAFETYVGYNFTRVNSAIAVPAFSANGGIGEVAYNFDKYLALVGSFPVSHNGNISNRHLDQTLFGYMFGPRGSIRFGRLVPAFEALFGATHDSRSFQGVPVTIVGANNSITLPQRIVSSATAFSMEIGGALDISINKHLAFRPVKLDYYLTRFQPLFIPNISTNVNRNRNQNNLLYSTGLNFRF